MPKKIFCIICGGKSPEHEISIISAKNILHALDLNLFDPVIIGISKTGQWFILPEKDLNIDKLNIGENETHEPVLLQAFGDKPILMKRNADIGFKPDVVFPITHGVLGEDGCIQGVLEHLGVPYIGPGVLGSAIGMDKDITKKIVSLAGIAVSPSFTFYKNDNIDVNEVISTLGLPLFVKPVNMGSGVGVIKVEGREQLLTAIKDAFVFDKKILIEKAMIGREVETAVLGNNNPVGTRVGEIIVSNGFYTYENKYENDNAQVIIPANNLSDKSMQIITNLALKAYKALQLDGLSRIDFFYEDDNHIYLNEVNTLPGFTNISMYPKLWQDAGLDFTTLLSSLAKFAEERFNERNAFKTTR